MKIDDDMFDQAAAQVAKPADAMDQAAAQVVDTQHTQLRTSLYSSLLANPEVVARATVLGRKAGLPADVVERNLPEVQRNVQLDEFDKLLQDSPTVAQWLSDQNNAKLAHDDVDNLSALEKTARLFKNTGRAIGSSVYKFNEGGWGLARAVGDVLPDAVGDPLANFAAQAGARQRAEAASMMPKADGIVESSWYSGMQSLGMNLLQLPLGIAGKSAAPLLWSMSANTGGQGYGEARDKGKGVGTSLLFGGAQGAVEGWTETFGLPALLSMLKPGGFAKKAAEYMIKEQGGEQVATLLQDLNEWAVLHPEQTFGDYAKDRPNAALQTALATAFGGGGQIAVMKVLQKAAERIDARGIDAQRTAQMGETLAQFNDLATASKVRSRDVESAQGYFQSLMDEGRSEVYITPDALMQSGLAQQIAQAIPDVAEQLQSGALTGHDIRIPIAPLMANFAGPELAQSVIPHLADEPGGFTPTTANEYMQSGAAKELEAEIERTLADKHGDDTFKQSTEAVRSEIKAQLDTAARFTPQVNDAYSTMVSNFFAVTAAKLGTTPEELYKRYPLRVGAESVGGGRQFDQGGRSLADVVASWDAQGIDNAIHEKNGIITLSKIIVPKDQRGKGIGTNAMRELLEYADRTGQQVALTPASDFGGNKRRLTKFYKGLGFRTYKGFAVREKLIRDPQELNQSAFHGSPYKFDKFSLEHMGKGEGAQAYGWGLYFAGNKQVAEYYRKNVIPQGKYRESVIAAQIADEYLKNAEGDFAKAADSARADMAWGDKKRLKKAVAMLDKQKIPKFGQLYEVNIPEDDTYLLWDKPLSEQPEKVKAALADKTMRDRAAQEASEADDLPALTGEQFYHELTRKQGSDEAASKYLHSLGIQGIKYLDGTSRNQNLEQIEAKVRVAEKRIKMAEKSGNAEQLATWKAKMDDAKKELADIGYNYVLFDDKAIEILNTFYQTKGTNRGAFNPASLSITLLKNADLSTFLHESGHFFLEVQADIVGRLQQEAAQNGIESMKPGERQMIADMDAVLKWFGVRDLTEWGNLDFEEKRHYHEQFARGFEAYLFDGTAPSIELQGVFQRFRAWLLNVYKELKALNVELTDEVRGVFDRMLASGEQITLTEQGRSMMPLFTSPEQAGMTPEEFAAYQALGVDATNEAIQNLQARGLRDMQWIHNARGRVIKQLQKEAKAQRAEVRMGVRNEVMGQPIYRAWQFLTGKLTPDDKIAPATPPKSDPNVVDETRDSLFTAIAKLGGLNKDAVTAEWGTDPKDKPASGVFGKPVWRRDGGLSPDAMVEALAQYGYLETDKHGKADLHELEEKFAAELRGETQYSFAHNPNNEMRAGDQVNNPDALGAGRLDLGELNMMGLPGEVVNVLKAHRMTGANGLHPDLVADLIRNDDGTPAFSSGDELVRKLAATDPPREEIEGITDQRMLEQFGDLSSPEAIERAADKAIHNDVRARMIATETNALTKATGKPKVLASAAKAFAAATIARLKVRNIKPSQYASAEARAAKAAAEASKAGDLATAAAEKRNQLVNTYATRAAYDAQDEVTAGVRYLKKFDSEGVRKGLDVEYLDQVDALLERFDLRKGQSLKAIDKRATLAAWLATQREAGMEPDIPPELENEALRKSFKDMTVEEFRGLVDTVKQIEHLGRLKHRLLTAKDQRAYEAVRDEIADSIKANAGKRKAETRTPTTNAGRFVQGLKRFGAAHIKAATLARVLDGGKDGGPMWEYFVRNANERGDMETTLRAEATRKLTEIMAPVFKQGKMGGAGQFFPTLNRSLNREARLAIALNTGNAGNMQRMLDGEGWSRAQITPVLESLTADEWHAVQAIWDHFESYRPQIAAKERRVYGKEPQWVEPVAFTVHTTDGADVNLRGGYYPIKYDPAASQRAEEHADAEGAKRQLQGAYTTATTRRSFTKARAEEVKGRPLLYSLSGLYSGVNDVIHDLTWHEWLIDVNRLLRSQTIDHAIRSHYGPEVKAQFKTWAADIAEGERGADGALDVALGKLRQNVSVAGLGYNVMSAAMQGLGLTQSIVRVGTKWMGKGIARYIAHPIAATREASKLSDFMANRQRTRYRELNELRNKVQGQPTEPVKRYAYVLMMRAQQMVDVPTWWGAYEKAISTGNEESRAVALADQAVIDAQGSGHTKDLSAIERGGQAQRLFTVFYSFMNTSLNIGVAQTMTARSRAKLAADYLLLYSVPAALGFALRNALTPGDSGDGDDMEKLMLKLLAEQLGYLTGLMVITREFGEAVKGMLPTGDAHRDYAGPTGVRMIADTYRFGKQAAQGEFDEAFFKATVNLTGDLFGLPSAEINRIATGAKALSEGKTENPAALVFGFQRP